MAKRFCKVIVIFAIFCTVLIIFCGCGVHTKCDTGLLRVHIRANSNSEIDQAVKMQVKSEVSEYLTDKLDSVSEFTVAYGIIERELTAVEKIASDTLARHGFNYGARARLNNEYFPTRAYGDKVIESGYYDALIIQLGDGKGDNWWCVIYPPLCFVSATGNGNLAYKSFIKELWDKFFAS
ncbi:MAG: stage II sporulation protein R [Clostridia bacterium]|nr:stage II sporulation protein R [Clostridia bacterium]